MLWARWLIYGVPTMLVALTVWSARQAADSRLALREEVVIASGEGVTPTLNPFLPSCEVDRQVSTLVHEPLLTIGADGKIAGGLVKEWSWSQKLRFWFANEQFAQGAQLKLKKLSPEQWAQWQLSSAEVVGQELQLSFLQAGSFGPASILRTISEFGPLPVETLRVELQEEARSHHEFFQQNAIEASQVKEVWFSGPKSYELHISGETVKFFEELELYYRNHPTLQARIAFVGRTSLFLRPQLELVLREDATFHDGAPVTAADVEATVGLVLARRWPVANAEGLEKIYRWDTEAPRHVRMTFRELYGPALMPLVGLPVLPGSWIETHAESLALGLPVFMTHPPSGTGKCVIEGATSRMLFLGQRGPAGQRMQFLLDQPPAAIRMGFAMKAVDIFWPEAGSLARLTHEPEVKISTTAPRSRLMVLWNCRQPLLQDVSVRQALGLAVNRPALLAESLPAGGAIQEGLFQPELWFAQRLAVTPFDPVRARALLYESGWSKGEDGRLMKRGEVLRLELLTAANNPERVRLAEKLREAWQSLGIEVKVVVVPWEELLDKRLPARAFDAALIGQEFQTTWDQAPYWHSSQAKRGLNLSGIADAQLDVLLTTLRQEYDLAQVPAQARAVENRILALSPFLPLFSGGSPLALRREMFSEQTGVWQEQAFSLRGMLESGAKKTAP